MPRLFQPLPSFQEMPAAGEGATVLARWEDDPDVALGCESALPVLQFESWEPTGPLPQGGAAAC